MGSDVGRVSKSQSTRRESQPNSSETPNDAFSRRGNYQVVTPSELTSILSLPADEAESLIYNRVHEIDRSSQLTFAEIGLLCRAVERHGLYKERLGPEGTMPQWIQLAAPCSPSTAYAAMNAVEELEPDLTSEQIAQIRKANMPVMVQLSTTARRDPEVIQAAQGSPEALVEHLQRHHPSQAIERMRVKRFSLPESLYLKVEEALQAARAEERANLTDAQALEAIISSYLADVELNRRLADLPQDAYVQ